MFVTVLAGASVALQVAPLSCGYSTLSPRSIPLGSEPTAVTIPVRTATVESADAGRISPARVSVSSLTGWMTMYSSRGSSDESMFLDSSNIDEA